MDIKKLSLLKGAKEAKGLTVIIDVFRAFSVACYLFDNGAKVVYPVGDITEAYQMKEENPNCILIGERHEQKCEGFDFGNSPTHIKDIDFTGKTIVHTTSSGTQGIALANGADEIITGAFVNAKAIANYIRMKNPQQVSLVGMGYEGLRTSEEDEFCADYISNELLNLPTNFDKMVEILKIGDGARLLDPKNHAHSPASDFRLCLDLNRFNFVLKVSKDNVGRNYLEKIIV